MAIVLIGSGCAPVSQSDQSVAYSDLGKQYQTAREDRARAAAQCMAEHGFPDMRVQENGTTRTQVGDEQQAAYNDAAGACLKKVCPHCGEKMSSETLSRLYDLEVEAAQCLDEHGVAVSEPPTLQAYLDAADDSRWDPFREAGPVLAQMTDADTIREDCPDPSSYATYW